MRRDLARPTYRNEPFTIRRTYAAPPNSLVMFALVRTLNARHFAGYEPGRVMLAAISCDRIDSPEPTPTMWAVAFEFVPTSRQHMTEVAYVHPDGSLAVMEIYERQDFNEVLTLERLEYAPHVTN